MMLFRQVFSFQLWRLLYSQIPLRHPYTRLLQHEYIDLPRKRKWQDWVVMLVIAGVMAWLITSSDFWVYGAMIMGFIFLLVSTGNIGAVVLGIHTIDLIYGERRKMRDDLIRITPLGYIGMIYSIIYIAFKRPRWIKNMVSLMTSITVYSLVIVTLFFASALPESLPLLLLLMLVGFAIYYDTLQSIILGSIFSATIASHSSQPRISTQLTAISLLLLLQMTLYIIASIPVFIFIQSSPNNIQFHLLILTVSLFTLFSIRELIIYMLIAKIRNTYGEKQDKIATIYNNLQVTIV